MCGGVGEHQRKEASKPSSDHQCKYCNAELNSSAEVHRHHMQKPIFCASRNVCTTIHGCYLCEGEGVHYRKDTHKKWSFSPYSDIGC